MRVGCSTLLFTRRPLAEACQSIATLGFRYVDLAVHEGWAHVNPTSIARDFERSLAAVQGALGPLQVVSCNASRHEPEATIRLAAALKAPVVTFPAAPPSAPWEEEVAALQRLVAVGKEAGVQVTVETHTDQLTEEPAAACRLCEEVPGLGLTLDPSHYLSGPHQGKEFGVVYPHVRHLHVRDAGRGGWPENMVEFGRGQVPWASVLAGLRGVGYDEGITIEYIDSVFPGDPLPSVRVAAHAVSAFWHG